MSAREEYWRITITEAAHECGLELTDEQADYMADAVAGSAENYGMYSGNDVASANLSASIKREQDKLRKDLEDERRKVVCRECNGRGTLTVNGPYHSATSSCFKCRGEGRHLP